MNLAGSTLNNIFLCMVVLSLRVNSSESDLIYILLRYMIPVFEEYSGREYFMNQNCSFKNCFLTDNMSILKDIKDYDAILFNAFQVFLKPREEVVPLSRSPKQKYIFMSSEPPAMYPVLSDYDGFFNYTFTYRLESDITWRFFVVKNKTDGKVVAPKKYVKWVEFDDMEPISEDVKRKLDSKNTAVVWLVSHCETPSKREVYVTKLMDELKNYNLSIGAVYSFFFV